MIKRFFRWLFKNELDSLNTKCSEVQTIIESLKQQQFTMTTAFASQLKNTQEVVKKYQDVFDNILSGIDVSVDVHEPQSRTNNWAVISLQGQRTDFVKFIDFGYKQ